MLFALIVSGRLHLQQFHSGQEQADRQQTRITFEHSHYCITFILITSWQLANYTVRICKNFNLSVHNFPALCSCRMVVEQRSILKAVTRYSYEKIASIFWSHANNAHHFQQSSSNNYGIICTSPIPTRTSQSPSSPRSLTCTLPPEGTSHLRLLPETHPRLAECRLSPWLLSTFWHKQLSNSNVTLLRGISDQDALGFVNAMRMITFSGVRSTRVTNCVPKPQLCRYLNTLVYFKRRDLFTYARLNKQTLRRQIVKYATKRKVACDRLVVETLFKLLIFA